jgi:hypothetical protein
MIDLVFSNWRTLINGRLLQNNSVWIYPLQIVIMLNYQAVGQGVTKR